MKIVPLSSTTLTLLIGPTDEPRLNRVVYVTNNGSNPVNLLCDSSDQNALSGGSGIALAPGLTQRFGATCVGDNDGTNAIWGFSTAGTTVSVQAIKGRLSLP